MPQIIIKIQEQRKTIYLNYDQVVKTVVDDLGEGLTPHLTFYLSDGSQIVLSGADAQEALTKIDLATEREPVRRPQEGASKSAKKKPSTKSGRRK